MFEHESFAGAVVGVGAAQEALLREILWSAGVYTTSSTPMQQQFHLRPQTPIFIFVPQVCGTKAENMAKAAQVISENACVDFIDINIGCPIDLVFKKVSLMSPNHHI